MEHFLGAKENLPAIFGVIGSVIAAFIGAVIGGFMTGRSAMRAQKQAAQDQRQRDQEAERRLVEGTLQAIAAELRVLKADVLDDLEKALKERAEARKKGPPGFPLPVRLVRTEQNRVTVFECNAQMLGKVEKTELREQIIRVYGLIKGLIDYSNDYARNYQRWQSLPESHSERPIVSNTLQDLESEIDRGLTGLHEELDELLKQIKTHDNCRPEAGA